MPEFLLVGEGETSLLFPFPLLDDPPPPILRLFRLDLPNLPTLVANRSPWRGVSTLIRLMQDFHNAFG